MPQKLPPPSRLAPSSSSLSRPGTASSSLPQSCSSAAHPRSGSSRAEIAPLPPSKSSPCSRSSSRPLPQQKLHPHSLNQGASYMQRERSHPPEAASSLLILYRAAPLQKQPPCPSITIGQPRAAGGSPSETASSLPQYIEHQPRISQHMRSRPNASQCRPAAGWPCWPKLAGAIPPPASGAGLRPARNPTRALRTLGETRICPPAREQIAVVREDSLFISKIDNLSLSNSMYRCQIKKNYATYINENSKRRLALWTSNLTVHKSYWSLLMVSDGHF